MKPPPLVYRPPHWPYLSIAHLDDHVAVVDKPAGLLSVPGKTDDLADCVAARAAAALPDALIVHRLDLATSGLILLARGKRAQRILSGQFAKRIIRKTYHAEVRGAPREDAGEIDLPLCADWPNRPRQKVCPINGRPSLTRWRVAARRGATTALTLTPVTGRSHQLRVHLAARGLPILGDPLYGTAADRAAAAEGAALALRATSLEWRCPGDGAWRIVESPPPGAE